MLSLNLNVPLKVHWCFAACMLGWIVGPHFAIQEHWFHIMRLTCAGLVCILYLGAASISSHSYAQLFVLFLWCCVNSRPIPDQVDRQYAKPENRIWEWCSPAESTTITVNDSNLEMQLVKSKHVSAHSALDGLNFCSSFGVRAQQWLSDKYNSHYFGFTRAFLFGDMSGLKSSVSRAFFDLGLIHVLVLSGGHLYFVLSFFGLLVRFMPLTLFSVRLLGITGFQRSEFICKIILFLIMTIYTVGTGFSVSIQRALIFSFFVLFPCKKLLAKANVSKLSAIFLVQMYLFPLESYERSFLLSWCGAIVLRLNYESRSMSWAHFNIGGNLRTQSEFGLISMVGFGQWSLLSLLSNIFLLPLFNVLIWFNLLGLIMREATGNEAFFQIQDQWISILSLGVQEHLKSLNVYLTVSEWQKPFLAHGLCLVTLVIVCIAETNHRSRPSFKAAQAGGPVNWSI